MRKLLFPLLALALVPLALAEPITIDWQKARALHERASRGETLSPDEQKYYEEAKRQRGAGGGPDGAGAAAESEADMQRAKEIHRRKEAGQSVTADEEKFLAEMIRKHTGGGGGGKRAERSQGPAAEPPKGLVPLTDLKATYHDQDGGLYGGGKNEPPAELAARARNAVAQIQPLDAEGKPASAGKIVLVSLGMSNTTQEFSVFKRIADADSRKASNLTIVDCAQGGKTAQIWANDDRVWDEAIRRINAAGVTPAQVEVIWLKQANAGPTEGWPAATDKLRDDIRKDIDNAQKRFPNLHLVFLSSRIYAGYATTHLNPEPYAYESAFAVRSVIQQQQPKDGPVLLWGPYLWTEGEKGRAIDSLKWAREDVGPDGTHPSDSGRKKVADLLLSFFTTDANATPWFVKK